MKIGTLIVFGLGLWFALQRAETAPLAYFVFFPFGFLLTFYFYTLRSWVLFVFSVALLWGCYFYRGLGLLTQETIALVGVTFSCFILLAYHRHILERWVREENERYERIRAELEALRERHATREESLLHLEKQVASLINLFEIARDFNECLDLREAAQILFKKVLPELFFEECNLILLNPPPPGKRELPTVAKTYVISKLGIEEKMPVGDDELEQQWLQKTFGQKGLVTSNNAWLFPLVAEGEFNALFVVRGGSKEDLTKFEVLASQLALQVRKVRLYEIVRELSIIDGLTGVFVRRHFLERFEEEMGRAMKQNFPVTVLMLDIDHFKRYNDEFGHLVGDATLREVAQVIRSNVRNVDIVARYGGEEFAVVIPETKEEGGVEVAERIRSAVARRAFRVYDEETKVTVSIGISAYPQDLPGTVAKGDVRDILFELLQRADRALYRAKEEGRNRVVLYRSLGNRQP